MKFKKLNNKGGIDPIAWLVGVVGFIATYCVWVFTEPILKQLIAFGTALMLPDIANQQFSFISDLFDYGSVFIAGIWLIFILLSSIKSEVQEKTFMSEY